MHIIIRNGGGKGTSKNGASYQGFTPHWNRALDKNPVWVGTRQQYDRELKTRGYVLDQGGDHKPKRSPYVAKPETPAVIRAIKQCTDKNGVIHPGSKLGDELRKRNVIRKRSDVEAQLKRVTQNGGFSAD